MNIMATDRVQELVARLAELHETWDAKFAEYRRDDIFWVGRQALEMDMADAEREMASVRYQLKKLAHGW